MTISEARSILHCPDAYGGIHGEKYGQALTIAFECMNICESLGNCIYAPLQKESECKE